MKSHPARNLLSALVLAVAPVAHGAARSFADMSLEELLNISVTSVSKRETKLGESAAAIDVITAEDVRRSGHTSLPELLRLVPGLTVARINSNEWALSSRGFTNQYANKLLVLVDGRSVYTSLFGGVYWNSQDTLLEDLDRIEVIRGPGATLWGANAVNGVINITTRQAKETQGALLTTSAGGHEGVSAALRYGGSLGRHLHFRTYVKHADRAGWVGGADMDAPDSWAATRAGTRVDWEPQENDLLTVQAERYEAGVGERYESPSLVPPFQRRRDVIHRNRGGHVLARWRHHFSASSDLTVQAYHDRSQQGDADTFSKSDATDLDLQHRITWGAHDVVWGAGYRTLRDDMEPSFYIRLVPDRERTEVFSGFVQDEITLVPQRLKLTAGSKFERNDYTGDEVQPSARLLWMPSTSHTLWTAVSRAVRTPSRFEHGNRTNHSVSQPAGMPPVVVALVGNPDVNSEELVAYEFGYRVEPSSRVSLSLSTFCNVYDRLIRYDTRPPVIEMTPLPPHGLIAAVAENSSAGETYGGELVVNWRPTDRWMLTASASLLRMQLHNTSTMSKESPRHQAHIRSYHDLGRGVQFNVAAYYSGSLETSLNDGRVTVPAYTRFDATLTWQVTPAIELGVTAQNLFDRGHAEFASYKFDQLTYIPRSVIAKVTCRF